MDDDKIVSILSSGYEKSDVHAVSESSSFENRPYFSVVAGQVKSK